uniref:Putative secreted protein n=1 Tax=Panstrongylus lignarius TaxID=156445 RepID=A0A224Y375_9HEMI
MSVPSFSTPFLFKSFFFNNLLCFCRCWALLPTEFGPCEDDVCEEECECVELVAVEVSCISVSPLVSFCSTGDIVAILLPTELATLLAFCCCC